MVVTKIRPIAEFVFNPNLLGRFLWVDVIANALDVKTAATAALNHRHADAKGGQNAHIDVNEFHVVTLGRTAARDNVATQMEAALC